MVLDLAPGWSLDLERGPDWLFVRLHPSPPFDSEGIELAERLWRLLESEFVHRLVLELEELPVLRSHLVGQLVLLHKRIMSQGGMLRICGLSPSNADVLRSCRLADRFPCYPSRADAVMGYRPSQPR